MQGLERVQEHLLELVLVLEPVLGHTLVQEQACNSAGQPEQLQQRQKG